MKLTINKFKQLTRISGANFVTDPPKDFFRNERHDENCKCKDKDCSQAFELCNQ